MSNIDTIVRIALTEIFRPGPDHALHDGRSLLPVDPAMREDVQRRGIQNPVWVCTKENLAEFGIHFNEPYILNDGNQRFNLARELSYGTLAARVRKIESLSDWWMHNISDNTMTVPETLESLIQKAKLAVRLDTPIEQIAKWVRKDVDTVRGWLPQVLKLGDDTGTVIAPEMREAIRNGEIDFGAAAYLAAGTEPAEQKEVLAEVAKVQIEALAKDAAGEKVTSRKDGARIETNAKGEKVAVPTRTVVENAKAKVKGKSASPKEKSSKELAKPTGDAAAELAALRKQIDSMLGQAAAMRKMPGTAEFAAGWEAFARALRGEKLDCAVPAVQPIWTLLNPASKPAEVEADKAA